MNRKILTLKNTSNSGQSTVNSIATLVAGRLNKSANKLMLRHIQSYLDLQNKVFIQMRHGAGYCGVPTQLEDGWLTMTDVSIHGTKKESSSQHVLIQIRDGSFIAHIHPVDSNQILGAIK